MLNMYAFYTYIIEFDGFFYYIFLKYTVMQSDGQSFCGYVVSNSFKWYTVMKTAFKTKNMKSESFRIIIVEI